MTLLMLAFTSKSQLLNAGFWWLTFLSGACANDLFKGQVKSTSLAYHIVVS